MNYGLIKWNICLLLLISYFCSSKYNSLWPVTCRTNLFAKLLKRHSLSDSLDINYVIVRSIFIDYFL
jgi:hypothetical protein